MRERRQAHNLSRAENGLDKGEHLNQAPPSSCGASPNTFCRVVSSAFGSMASWRLATGRLIWRLFANCSRSPRSLNRPAHRPRARRPVGIAQSAEPRCRSVPTSPPVNSLIDASSSTVRSLPTKLARRRATARRRSRVPLPRKPASNYRSGQNTNASASARRLAVLLPQASPSGQHAFRQYQNRFQHP